MIRAQRPLPTLIMHGLLCLIVYVLCLTMSYVSNKSDRFLIRQSIASMRLSSQFQRQQKRTEHNVQNH